MKKKLQCVMLIDDDEPTNFLNQMVLEQTGYVDQVVTKSSGREALEYLANVSDASGDCIQPDLIFLDLNMPAMNGWEFLEEYKHLGEAQKARMMIVMLTTSLFPEDQAKAMTVPEISSFEHKPLTVEKLDKIMDTYFQSH